MTGLEERYWKLGAKACNEGKSLSQGYKEIDNKYTNRQYFKEGWYDMWKFNNLKKISENG